MKKISLRKVHRGEVFAAFGEEFVALDHVGGGVLAIKKDIWKREPFSTNYRNNLNKAGILRTLGEYSRHLRDNGMERGDIIPMSIDLKSPDGTRVYGYCNDCYVCLLTLEQYGKHKDIIPLVDGAWWLATPYWTPCLRSPNAGNTNYVLYVNSGGDWSGSNAGSSYGVRPALTFNSSLLVSIESNGPAEKNLEVFTELELLAELRRRMKERS